MSMRMRNGIILQAVVFSSVYVMSLVVNSHLSPDSCTILVYRYYIDEASVDT